MAYCTVDDVYSVGLHGGDSFTDTTNPTIAQVNEWISKIARKIDARLSASGVTTPVSQVDSPKAFNLLKDLNAFGTAVYVEMMNANRWGSDDERKTLKILLNEYEEWLKEYEEFPVRLEDAVLSNKHHLLETAEENIIWSGTSEIYDYSHVNEMSEGDLKPFFRHDTEY